MRLLSCHIAAFGRIRDKDMAFAPGINCFPEPNGSGKSTTAEFLCAMFYGMDGYTKSTVQFPERLHYFPAGSQIFGGTVTFERNGEIYRIERSFGEKSQSGDRLTVYKNGNLTEELGECPGVTVFGISRESFVRTAFFNGNTGTAGATPDLIRALHGTVAAPKDGETAEAAAGRLEDAAAKLQGKRKNSGILAGQRQELTEVTKRLLQLRETEETLEPLYRQRSEQEEKLKALRIERAAAAEWLAVEGRIAVFREKQKAAGDMAAGMTEIDSRYPQGIPGTDVTGLLREAGTRFTALGNPEDSRAAASVFLRAVPEREDYTRHEELIHKINALTEECKTKEQQKAAIEKEYRREQFRFAEKGADFPTEEATRLSARLTETEEKITAGRAGLREEEKIRNHFLPFGVTLLALSLVFLLAGLFLRGSLAAVSVVLCLLGAVSLVAGGLLLYIPFVRRRRRLDALRKETDVNQQRWEEDNNALLSYLAPMGYEGKDAQTLYGLYRTDLQRFLSHQEAWNYFESTIAENERIAGEMREDVKDFLDFHGIASENLAEPELYAAFDRAWDMYLDYSLWQIAREKAETALIPFDLPLPAAGKETEAAADMDGDRENRAALQSAYARKCAEAEAYQRDELPAVLPPKPEKTAEETESLLHQTAADMAALDRRIEETERETARIGEYEERERVLRESIAQNEHRAAVCLAAAKAIREADARLTEKYIAPVRDRFDTYADLLGSITGEKVMMDISYRVKTEHDGVYLDERYFSEGQKALCSLCLRLAMMDNIYTKDKPFLVFDDPFAGLDADKMAKAAAVLEEVGKTCQILYFCCHESRIIGKE